MVFCFRGMIHRIFFVFFLLLLLFWLFCARECDSSPTKYPPSLKPSIELEFEQRNSVGEEKFSGLKFMGRDVFKSVLLHYSLSIFALAHISFLYSLFLRDRSWVRFSVVVLSAVLFS